MNTSIPSHIVHNSLHDSALWHCTNDTREIHTTALLDDLKNNFHVVNHPDERTKIFDVKREEIKTRDAREKCVWTVELQVPTMHRDGERSTARTARPCSDVIESRKHRRLFSPASGQMPTDEKQYVTSM